MTTRELARRIKSGLHLDNLRDAISDFDDYARKRPDVGHGINRVLREIEGRWSPYEASGLDPEELRRVRDIVTPRILDILHKVEDIPGYDSTADLNALLEAYESLFKTS